jgi:hypothetical protein
MNSAFIIVDGEFDQDLTQVGLKPAPRLEQVDDEHSDRAQDYKHRPRHAMILPHNANPKPDGI